MYVDGKIVNGVMHIALSGELDEYTANYVRNRMDELIDKTQSNKVIVDLSDLSFMDSTGVGVLIGRYKKIKSHNKQIFIYNPNTTIEKVFKMSGLYQIMPKIS